jgi:hypothetical protein
MSSIGPMAIRVEFLKALRVPAKRLTAPYERGGAWKAELAKELKAAGYEVNFNSAMI